MPQRCRLAVIGAGIMGRHHLAVASGNAAFEIVGVADPTPTALERMRGRGHEVFTDYRRMLDETVPEAVVIATPNAYHVPVALACIERGIAALVEKPVADSLEGAMQLSAAVARTNVPVLVGHHRRHNPLLKKAASHIAQGGIGQILAAVGLWLRRKPDEYFADRWKQEASAGGGVLLINTIHDFDCLRMLCGEIRKHPSCHIECRSGLRRRGYGRNCHQVHQRCVRYDHRLGRDGCSLVLGDDRARRPPVRRVAREQLPDLRLSWIAGSSNAGALEQRSQCRS